MKGKGRKRGGDRKRSGIYIGKDIVGVPAGEFEIRVVLDLFQVNAIRVEANDILEAWRVLERDLNNLDKHLHGAAVAEEILLFLLDFIALVQESLEGLQSAGNKLQTRRTCIRRRKKRKERGWQNFTRYSSAVSF